MKRSVWNVGNNKKKGSWKQATVGLMLFHCDYAETTIIIYYFIILTLCKFYNMKLSVGLYMLSGILELARACFLKKKPTASCCWNRKNNLDLRAFLVE